MVKANQPEIPQILGSQICSQLYLINLCIPSGGDLTALYHHLDLPPSLCLRHREGKV